MTERIRGRRWLRIRAQVLSANPLCADCLAAGVTRIADEVDHVIALSKGGTNEMSNLVGLCREHHAQKSALEAGKSWRFGCDESGWPLDPASHWNQK
jgi:5-methylcytosine-specific restriction enzyme A